MVANRGSQIKQDIDIYYPENGVDELLLRVPDVLLRLSQRDVAAYIGVTPEALSRHLKSMISASDIQSDI